MASTINASSSGSGGLISTGDASGVLQLQSNGTVALSISGAATTFGGNMLLETSGNPSMTVKTTGAGNNPWYRLQADTNYWDVLGVFSDANDTLRIRYNGSDKMVLNNGGIVALAGGDSDATGTGITFPASQNASTNANTLDDYEEGTWTPQLWQGSTQITSVTSAYGYYVKVGKMLFIGGYVYKNGGAPSASGTWEMRGLPFSVLAGTGATAAPATYMAVNGSQSTQVARFQANSSSALTLYGQFVSTSWTTSYVEMAFSGCLQTDS